MNPFEEMAHELDAECRSLRDDIRLYEQIIERLILICRDHEECACSCALMVLDVIGPKP